MINVEDPDKFIIMDYVFVLEDDPLYRRQIQKALADINPLMGIKFFHDLEDFYGWIKGIMAEGARPWAEGDEKDSGRVRMIVSRCEFIGHERLELLYKVRDLFVRRGMSPAEEPCTFVLTAFDDPGFQIAQYQNPIIYNILFKPFDELILREHLSFALGGRMKPKEFGLTNQKIQTVVEMLKTVDMESFSDIGFTSRSNKAFELGYVSKYYGEAFASEKSNSVFARLAKCQPHPQYPNEFQLEFQFYGNDSSQISAIRRRIRGKDRHHAPERHPPKAPTIDSPVFVVVEPRDADFESIAGTLRRKIKGAVIQRFNSLKLFDDELGSPFKAKSGIVSANIYGLEMNRDYAIVNCEPADATLWNEPLKNSNFAKYFPPQELKALALWMMGPSKEYMAQTTYNGGVGVLRFEKADKKISMSEPDINERLKFLRARRSVKDSVSALIVNGKDLDPANLGLWESVKKTMTTELAAMPPAYLVVETPVKEDDKKLLAAHFEDIFVNPVDRGYFLQKLAFRVPGLKILEDPVTIAEVKHAEKIKTANPVEVEELSEAAMTMKYYRAISPGSFREFILWQPYILGAPQLLGTSYASEEVDGKDGGFKISMVLFGMRDQLLKSIRLWIRDNYVHAKEKSSG